MATSDKKCQYSDIEMPFTFTHSRDIRNPPVFKKFFFKTIALTLAQKMLKD
jgi:hypothetical protein